MSARVTEDDAAAAPPTRVCDDDRATPARDPDLTTTALVGGRYATRGALGHGGMATVFDAVDLATGDAVALKRPRLVDGVDGHTAELMVAEARAMARVAHPNIARIRDVGADAHGPWFVMDRLAGESLHDHIARRGTLPAAEAVARLLPLLDGVAAVHRCGLAHGDIKPSNVILARAGGQVVPTLIDFGVAARTEAHERAAHLLGTPTYMAPERFLLRAPPDVASDIWSLGALLYTCLAGVAPFRGERVADVVYEVLTQAPPELAGVHPAVRDVIDRALRREPEERFLSAEAMATALREALRAPPAETPRADAPCAAG